MTLISIEGAKTRLADCNVLLKYMVFLQKNGFSDCGKGQIIGQVSLLQEYLKEEEQQESKQSSIDKSSQQQKDQHKHQTILKDANKVGKTVAETFRDNSTNNTSESKLGLLGQVEGMIDKAKDTTIEENELSEHWINGQVHQTLTQPIRATREDNYGKLQPQISGVTINKEAEQSWINKIKKLTEVENWRSWQ
ncbi:MAG: hypothetical protein JO297_13670 [Nitrososphaeraceae archaeon]|nr:hypothetical protein [Nitrososphaeraceae archaeon]